MRIDISLFGVLLMLVGLNWFHWRKWWAEIAYKQSPLIIINQKATEIFLLIMGITTMVAGVAFIIWGVLGAPSVTLRAW
jgi:hypothetical protein